MKIIAFAAVALLAVTPPAVLGKTNCTFDQAGVAAQLSAKAGRVKGAKKISPTEFKWDEPFGRTVSIGYGGCMDLGAEVSVSNSGHSGKPLNQSDLLRAVARYWSSATAKGLASALAGSQGTGHVEGKARVVEFGPSVSEAFPAGFTVSIAPDHVSVSWQEL